jgi:hypothetical protein
MNDLVPSRISLRYYIREDLTLFAIPTSQQASAANFPNRGQSVELDINTETTLHSEKKHEAIDLQILSS